MMTDKPNRRHFLFGALAATTQLTHPVKGQEAADTIGTAIIGTGNRGHHLLTQVLEQPNVKVTALCDIKSDRLDKAATTAGDHKPFTTPDFRRVLERDDVDAVFVATPCDLHVSMSMAALQAGKHVYCEKPVGTTPEGIEQLVQVAKDSDKVFQAGQQRRSEVRLRKTIEMIHDGVAGDVIMIKAQRHSSHDLPHDFLSSDWFFYAERSGDVIVEMSVHNLDVCNWVVGGHPARAAGFGGTLLWKNEPPGRTNMDGYTLSYEYPNDVKLSFTQVFFHARGLPGGGQYTYVYGKNGSVDLDTSTYYPLEPGRGNRQRVLVDPVEEDRQAHIKAFYESIRTGKEPPAGIMIGATGALTAILGREAIYRKKLMEWSDLGVTL